jgi:hypothetical protein
MPVQIDGDGADDYRLAIFGCGDLEVACGDRLQVKTGNMDGPTRQGVEGGGGICCGGLIGDPPDQYHGIADYGPNHSEVSPSLVVVPVWNACQNTQFRPGGGGECPAVNVPSGDSFIYQIDGYALVFIEGVKIVGGDTAVVGRFIDVFGCTGTSGLTQLGPFSLPIRLVRVPGD